MSDDAVGDDALNDDATLLRDATTCPDRTRRDMAFRELVDRHRHRVWSISRRYFGDAHDAEDATQETFLRVLRHGASFRGDAQVSTWLYRVATNTCHDLARHRARRPAVPLERLDDLAPAAPDPTDAVDDAHRLRAALAELDDDVRALLLMCTVEGVPYDEVAAVFGIAVGTVKSRVHRARARLAELLADIEPDPSDRSGDVASPSRPSGPRPIRGPPTATRSSDPASGPGRPQEPGHRRRRPT